MWEQELYTPYEFPFISVTLNTKITAKITDELKFLILIKSFATFHAD